MVADLPSISDTVIPRNAIDGTTVLVVTSGMGNIRRSTLPAQVAAHLREKILKGDLKDVLPGRESLAVELGVSPMTVLKAIAQLEDEGLLVSQGNGLPRRIVGSKSGRKSRSLRIAVLRYEPEDIFLHFVVEFVHRLREAGHDVIFADKTQTGLRMDVKRVARMVAKTSAEAWIVIGGSNEILEWFASRPQPCFGLFGRISKLPIAGAGPSKKGAYRAAAERLVELGHRRIVLLTRWADHSSAPRDLYDELEALGVPVGSYNIPNFSDNPEALQGCLDSLFATTPPTAIVAESLDVFVPVQQFLARRRIPVPEEVSLICGDPDPIFHWCRPTIAHITWDSTPWIRRMVGWADNVAQGKHDTRQAIRPARFVDGGTVGPAP